MTITTSNTGSITSLGIGSGLDVNSIISSLMAADSVPLTDLQNKATSINTQISAVGQLTSLTSTLGDAAGKLADATFWDQTTATSSDTSSVTATTSGSAASGDYSVTVQQLALGQTVTSTALPTEDSTLSSGTLTIQLGTWASGTPPTFTNQPNANAVSITIDPTDTSLSAIRDKINGANAGVTASIITDSTGARLSIRSTATGAENGFKITATEDTDDGDPTTGLSALAFDPSSGNSQLSLNQSSQDALATVNGIPVQSASNTLANVSDGLSLTLVKASATPIDVKVATDTASMTTAINAFVTAYNALNSAIHTDTAYNPTGTVAPGTSQPGGPLEGDPTIISFQNQLRNVLNVSSTTNSMYASLSSIGISVQADGSLSADSTKLAAALANPEQVKALMSADGTTAQDTGLMVQFQNVANQATGTDGLLQSRSSGLKSQLARNSQEQTDMQAHLDDEQTRLTAQYQALDTTMSQMSALSSYVTQQVTMMEKA